MADEEEGFFSALSSQSSSYGSCHSSSQENLEQFVSHDNGGRDGGRPNSPTPLVRVLFQAFKLLSFITFQYVPPVEQDNDNAPRRCCTSKKRLCSLLSITYLIIGTIIIGGIVVNLGPFIVFLIDWIKCPLVYHNMCFIFEFHSKDPNNTEIPEILMRDLPDDGKTYYKRCIHSLSSFKQVIILIEKQHVQQFNHLMILQSSLYSSSFSLVFPLMLSLCLHLSITTLDHISFAVLTAITKHCILLMAK